MKHRRELIQDGHLSGEEERNQDMASPVSSHVRETPHSAIMRTLLPLIT